jgi:hypothetical protein
MRLVQHDGRSLSSANEPSTPPATSHPHSARRRAGGGIAFGRGGGCLHALARKGRRGYRDTHGRAGRLRGVALIKGLV